MFFKNYDLGLYLPVKLAFDQENQHFRLCIIHKLHHVFMSDINQPLIATTSPARAQVLLNQYHQPYKWCVANIHPCDHHMREACAMISVLRRCPSGIEAATTIGGNWIHSLHLRIRARAGHTPSRSGGCETHLLILYNYHLAVVSKRDGYDE